MASNLADMIRQLAYYDAGGRDPGTSEGEAFTQGFNNVAAIGNQLLGTMKGVADIKRAKLQNQKDERGLRELFDMPPGVNASETGPEAATTMAGIFRPEGEGGLSKTAPAAPRKPRLTLDEYKDLAAAQHYMGRGQGKTFANLQPVTITSSLAQATGFAEGEQHPFFEVQGRLIQNRRNTAMAGMEMSALKTLAAQLSSMSPFILNESPDLVQLQQDVRSELVKRSGIGRQRPAGTAAAPAPAATPKLTPKPTASPAKAELDQLYSQANAAEKQFIDSLPGTPEQKLAEIKRRMGK